MLELESCVIGGDQFYAQHKRRTDYRHCRQLFLHRRLNILIWGNYQLIFVSLQKYQYMKFIKQKYEPTPNELRRTVKIFASPGGTETIVWNIYSYQVQAMVGTNEYTNEKHKFYNPIAP